VEVVDEEVIKITITVDSKISSNPKASQNSPAEEKDTKADEDVQITLF
tara:strand:+ start:408 stop:551 length:144 start_codon:yes stop_codon:yes gene_type:complete